METSRRPSLLDSEPVLRGVKVYLSILSSTNPSERSQSAINSRYARYDVEFIEQIEAFFKAPEVSEADLTAISELSALMAEHYGLSVDQIAEVIEEIKQHKDI